MRLTQIICDISETLLSCVGDMASCLASRGSQWLSWVVGRRQVSAVNEDATERRQLDDCAADKGRPRRLRVSRYECRHQHHQRHAARRPVYAADAAPLYTCRATSAQRVRREKSVRQ